MANTITEVRLLAVPLENDNKRTFYFSNVTAQTNYFLGCTQKTKTDYSYQRKDKIIRYSAHIDTLLNCNYVMYKNSAYSSKWYYAFITNMEYINDERTDITIETDVIQTWLFDYTVRPSFIEREHVDNDTVGLHTIPENLETGTFICNELSRDLELQELVYIVQTTKSLAGNDLYATNYGGVWQSGGAFICPTGDTVHDIVQALSNNGHADAVMGVYVVPAKIVNNSNDEWLYSGQASPVTYSHTFAKQTTLDGYTPRNKKLLCYPYNYILFSNNSGSSNILQYEHFSTADCQFEIAGVPSVGGSIKCAPLNYKGLKRMQQEGLMLGKFPTTSWSEDLYTNWLTQNGVNIGLGIASSGLTVLGGVGMMFTGGGALAGAGMIASGLMGVAQTMGQVHQMSFTPNSAEGNTNGGDINTSYKMNVFYFHKMSIKQEYAKSIDGFFDMFGYKVNRVGTPLKNHRQNYWYTKTIDVDIDANIPMNDLQKIKACYNKGITFWKNTANIGNYSVSNGIV